MLTPGSTKSPRAITTSNTNMLIDYGVSSEMREERKKGSRARKIRRNWCAERKKKKHNEKTLTQKTREEAEEKEEKG